jgi:hypothetical protein
MDKPFLTDQDVYPSDDVLAQALGRVKKAWGSFMAYLSECYPSFSGEWRYYQDGKSWLHKVTRKKKTICWVSVYKGAFKTTFYFADKAEDLIKASSLDKDLIEQFVHGKRYGKIRGITVQIKKLADLNDTKILIEIKEQLK